MVLGFEVDGVVEVGKGEKDGKARESECADMTSISTTTL
jgi:hypothetical protein